MSDWHTLDGLDIPDIHEAIRNENKLVSDIGGMILAYIGTDSQNLGSKGTAFVQCVALHKYDDCAVGKGGRVFYIKFIERKHTNRNVRLLREAELSINLAQKLQPLFDELKIPFEVHLDVNSYAGKRGENLSNEVHDQAKGWVESVGFVCRTKPDAVISSIVADRMTK
jgi:predicted RNase H-related nuclease YkuK (DUF458 family)